MPAIANPCCCSRCVVFRDDFASHSPGFKNGLFGSWYANPDLSSFGTGHHAWSVTFPGAVNDPSLYWMQVDNHYATIDGRSGGPFRLYYVGDVPRHFSASVSMRPIRENSIGSLVYANTYNDIGGPWYRLEVEASSSTYGDADAAKSCGYLRIRRLLPNNLTVEVPVPGLCAFGTGEDFLGMHSVRLCYNPDTKILSGNVRTVFGETHWVHTKSATPVPEHVSNLDPDAGTGVTNLWIEATNWGTLPSSDTTGVYIFDNFRLSQTKNTPEDFGYGYGYGYGESEDCPCCGGCTIAGFYFNDPANDGLSASEADCRILQSGTAVQSGGALSASSNTTLTWLGSYSGVGDNCQPAAAQSVTASINSAEYGRQVTVSIGSVEATLTFESSDGAGDGTLSLSGVDPVTVPDATINTLMALRLCVNAEVLVASAGGKVLLRELSDPPADTPVAIALEAGTLIYGFDIDFGCSEDCTPNEEDPPNDCDWCDGETVPTVLAFRPHIPGGYASGECSLCDLINDHTFVMRYESGCRWSQEGGQHIPLPDDPCEWQPGCEAGPDSSQICLVTALTTAIDEDTGHLVMSGLVMLTSTFFTCRIHFEQDFDITEERPDCEAFFSGGAFLPFKEFSGFTQSGPCNLCAYDENGDPVDTSTWYLEVVGL